MMVDMQVISFDLITSSCFEIQGRVGGRQYAVHVKSAIVQSFDGLEVAYYIYTTVHFNVPNIIPCTALELNSNIKFN